MCGFVGSLSYKIINQEKISSSNEHLVCRGPDSKGTLFSNAEEIKYSFIFNRLSILDLSDKANQPMFSEDQNKIIMFNGEIFNHAELRTELQELGVTFKTSNSDTEVLLKGISYFGLDYVNKIRGQFAIFFLDKNIKTFYLIRDRLGQKPLYYNLTESTFSFSSNLKTLVIKAIKNRKGKIITVEVDNLNQLKSLMGLKFDRILLDNMSINNLRKAVKIINGLYETEASGNVSLERVKLIARTGVNRISVGSITHSAPAIDFKFEI